MDQRSFEALELDSLIDMLARHVQTPLGKRRALALRPSTDKKEILHALDMTTECVNYLAKGERVSLGGITDPEPSLAKLQVEGVRLEPLQIVELERLISAGIDLRERFKDPAEREQFPNLSSIAAQIPDLRPLLKTIHGKILPDGTLDDNASPELRLIRRQITESRLRIRRKLESLLQAEEQAVQDEIITFRNDRFVIPIRTDRRSQVPGVVHGLSSSGQTTFIEPLSIIDHNNELVHLREQEEIEIANILLALTNALRSNLPSLRLVAWAVEEFDFAQAKARFSAEYQCAPPRIAEDEGLDLQDARHILLEQTLRKSGGAIVPISLALTRESHILLISGPNAGGKTVVIKTVGLIVLMAQMGLHVPARSAALPVFDQVFADIGDQQSIAANLSTFTAHMRNVAEIARQLRPPALALIDEIGTGTDPDEGASLAIAIVDYFRRAGAMTIATTHYPALKMWASQTAGVANASVEFDERTLRPTYRLILGIAGASSGIEIARRMNVPEAILDEAQGLVEPSHAQAREYLKKLKAMADEQISIRNALEQEREATARKLAHLDLDYAKRESARRAEFEQSFARVLRQFESESERLIKSVKDRVEAGRIRRAAAARTADLRRAGQKFQEELALETPANKESGSRGQAGAGLAPMQPVASGEIQEGDRVKIRSIGQEGIVESVREDVYTIALGSLRFRSEIGDLQLISLGQAAAKAAEGPRRSPQSGPELDAATISELNVIGLTVDEAIPRVDKFLDEAFFSGAENVRIIHGHGKGILRRAIAELLTNHPQVERFSLAPPDKGGGGATLVELRK
jgi:DNA mismatch repair protein MutS2